jgi:Family of unknown function (DUF6353)
MGNPLLKNLLRTASDHLPSILSAAAVVGLAGTVVLAVKATPDAIVALREARQDKEYNQAYDEERSIIDQDKLETQELSRVEIVQATWRIYLPAGICGLSTVACILGSNAMGLRRQAALLGAYTLVDTGFRDYREKVAEHLTAPKRQKIEDELREEQIARQPMTQSTVFITGGGDQPCYDTLSGRYFKSNIETLRRAANDLDEEIRNDMFASQNEFYRLIGLAPTTLGAEMGWNLDNRLDLVFSSHLADDGTPCLAMGYARLPRINFDKL